MRKGMIRKLTAVFLLSFLSLTMVVSCGNTKNPERTETVVLQCNGVEITESVYKMYLYEAGSALKQKYIPEYTDEEYDALSKEELDAYYQRIDTFWETEIDGRMPFEIVRENALENLKVYAFYSKECKDNNIAMTEEELRSFTSQMELYYAEQLDAIETLFGVTKDQYISYLAEMDVFASYVDIQASGISVEKSEITEKFNAYREKYAKVAVQTVFLKKTEQKDAATQKALAEDIKTRIANGEDFTTLVAAYSDYQKYEDGSMIVTGTTTFDEILGNGFSTYVLNSNEKDLSVLETDLGYCVIQTVAVDMLENARSELEAMIQDEKYINRVTSIVDGNVAYDIAIVDETCYNAIVDVPKILK